MADHEHHPDWNELAALADGGADAVPPEVLAHLARCPRCLAAWTAAVEHRDRELAGVTPVPGRGRELRRRPRQIAWGVGGLAAAAVLLMVLIPRGDPADADSEIRGRLAELSRVGLVYPRVEELADTAGTDYRAGTSPGGELDLAPWAERFGEENADTVAAFWLAAGHLGNGRLDQAEDVLRRALARSPGSRDLRQLAAIAAYRHDELAKATEQLRTVLAADPDDELATINLWIIGQESGREEIPRTTIERLARESTNPAIRDRAEQLLRADSGR